MYIFLSGTERDLHIKIADVKKLDSGVNKAKPIYFILLYFLSVRITSSIVCMYQGSESHAKQRVLVPCLAPPQVNFDLQPAGVHYTNNDCNIRAALSI